MCLTNLKDCFSVKYSSLLQPRSCYTAHVVSDVRLFISSFATKVCSAFWFIQVFTCAASGIIVVNSNGTPLLWAFWLTHCSQSLTADVTMWNTLFYVQIIIIPFTFSLGVLLLWSDFCSSQNYFLGRSAFPSMNNLFRNIKQKRV